MAKHLLVGPLVVLAAVLLVGPGLAAETRILVLNPDRNLLNAVSVALSPWGLRVVPVQGTNPPADPTQATGSARAIAQAQAAGALLWITEAPGGPASLWMYDAQTEQLTVRPLPKAPPYDDAAAAAMALTIKTLLRSSTAAPQQERTEPPTLPTTVPTPGTAEATQPPPPAVAAPAARAAEPASAPATRAEGEPSTLAPAPSRHSWRLHVMALAQTPTGTSATFAARAGIAGSWWPSRWGEHVGFGLGVLAGPNIDVLAPGFVGNFGDVDVGADARARLGGSSLSLEIGAGPSVHVTSLSGTGVASDRSTSVARVDPAIEVEAVADIALGARVRLGPLVGASLLLRTQRYSLEGDLVLRMPTAVFDLGGRVSLALD
jgi:hypothetical protein